MELENAMNGGSKQFKMLKPKVIKNILEKALSPGITSIV